MITERSLSRVRPRNFAWSSAQRRFKKMIFEETIDHSGRGIPQGHEGLTEDETELFGGNQLGCAFQMAYDEDPSNGNVQRVLQ